MLGNFDNEALVLIALTCITFIIIILRIALVLWQCKFTEETDLNKSMRRQSSSFQNVTVVNADEKIQKPIGNKSIFISDHRSDNSSNYNENYETVLLDSTLENIDIHPVYKQVYSNVKQSDEKRISKAYSNVKQCVQERIDEDETSWCHSFQESEKSVENPNIPQTSAYGMRKVGKKKYIDDTNIGSPRSKALEQKSSEQIKMPKGKRNEMENEFDECVNQTDLR